MRPHDHLDAPFGRTALPSQVPLALRLMPGVTFLGDVRPMPDLRCATLCTQGPAACGACRRCAWRRTRQSPIQPFAEKHGGVRVALFVASRAIASRPRTFPLPVSRRAPLRAARHRPSPLGGRDASRGTRSQVAAGVAADRASHLRSPIQLVLSAPQSVGSARVGVEGRVQP